MTGLLLGATGAGRRWFSASVIDENGLLVYDIVIGFEAAGVCGFCKGGAL